MGVLLPQGAKMLSITKSSVLGVSQSTQQHDFWASAIKCDTKGCQNTLALACCLHCTVADNWIEDAQFLTQLFHNRFSIMFSF